MIAVAWIISLALCIPQAFIFQGSNCVANFAPGWGVKAYVTWFSFSNFFIPLVILLFCYSRICYDIWDNVNRYVSIFHLVSSPSAIIMVLLDSTTLVSLSMKIELIFLAGWNYLGHAIWAVLTHLFLLITSYCTNICVNWYKFC